MRQSLRVLVASVAFCLSVGLTLAGSSARGAAPEIVFEPPKAVVVRQTNGVPARGELLRIDNDELWLKAVNGSEVKLKLERVRSIKTSDESFEFWPSKESFDELTDRISKVPGATLTGNKAGSTTKSQARARQDSAVDSKDADTDDVDARKARNRQARERQQNENSDDDERPGKNPFSTQAPLRLPQPGQEDADPTEVADASSTDDSANSGSDGTGSTGTQILICSNCSEELPAGFVSGDACPHCGKVATYEVEGTTPLAGGGGTAATAQNPFAAPGGGPPTAAMPAVMPAAAPTATTAPAGGQGMSMANIPLIGKIGIFAGFIIAGWLIMQRR